MSRRPKAVALEPAETERAELRRRDVGYAPAQHIHVVLTCAGPGAPDLSPSS